MITDGETYSINAKEFVPPKVVPVTEPVKELYKNCTELRKVYLQSVKEGHPAYEAQYDVDNDG